MLFFKFAAAVSQLMSVLHVPRALGGLPSGGACHLQMLEPFVPGKMLPQT